MHDFDGKKFFKLSTTTWLGGSNPFLGWGFIIVAGIMLIVAVLSLIKQCVYPRCVATRTWPSDLLYATGFLLPICSAARCGGSQWCVQEIGRCEVPGLEPAASLVVRARRGLSEQCLHAPVGEMSRVKLSEM